jgi:AAA15 family ATPase/GTPase
MNFINLKDLKENGFNTNNSMDILSNLSKINVFIGDNNSGKSRFIRALSANITELFNRYLSINKNLGSGILRKEFNLVFKQYEKDIYDLSKFPIDGPNPNLTAKVINALIYFNDINDYVPTQVTTIDAAFSKAKSTLTSFANDLAKKSHNNLILNNEFLSFYIPVLRGLKPLEIEGGIYNYNDIYKVRIQKDYGNSLNVFSGLEIFEDIKSKLLGLENDRKLIAEFELFLKENIFKQKITLIPKYKEDILNIKIGDEEQRSIVNLGDGIQALILILYPIFINKQKTCFFFIEEPETHLHPNFQKLLIKLMSEISERHQFFITTHSNSFVNNARCSVFSINKNNGISKINHLKDSQQKSDILSTLGYKASDLLQTNFIVWVEGPSDKVYLQYLISKYDSNLQENIHYSIMFYGGSAGKYLFDSELDKSLILNLNRNCAYICDSDKDSVRCSSTKYIETTKLIKRLNMEGVFAWMTPYREFENHINANLFLEAVRSVYRENTATLVSDGKYSDRFEVQVVNNLKQPTKNIRLTEELLNQIKRAKNKVDNIPDDILKQELQESINFTVGTDTNRVNRKVDIAEYIVKNGFEPDSHLKNLMKILIKKINNVNNII